MAFFSLENIKQVIRKTLNKSGNFRGIPSKIRAKHEARLRPRFERIKEQMIKEFLNHPVTKELNRGPRVGNYNTSKTLNGYGELFSFIGFDRDYDPIEPILEKLLETRLDHIKTTLAGSNYRVAMPDKEEIFSVAPMPWAEGDMSWAEGIEIGIPGLGYYLNRDFSSNKESRSKAGLQIKMHKLRDGEFKKMDYISTLLEKYKQKFEALS